MGSRKRRIQGRVSAVLKTWPADSWPFSTSELLLYTFPVFLDRASARLRRRTGAYVSGINAARTSQSMPVNIAMTPSIQRQPIVSPTKPPTVTRQSHNSKKAVEEFCHVPIGPMTGPRKGAAAKTLIARPRWEAGNMSDITPPAFVNGEDPNAPAKNLRTIRVWMFFEPAAPALKIVSIM